MRMRYCELCSNLLNVFGFQQWRKSAQSWEDADFLHANKIEGLFRFGSLLAHQPLCHVPRVEQGMTLELTRVVPPSRLADGKEDALSDKMLASVDNLCLRVCDFLFQEKTFSGARREWSLKGSSARTHARTCGNV